MTPAPINDAVTWAIKRRPTARPHPCDRHAASILQRVPLLVENCARPYVADAFAAVWADGMFRDELIERSAGLDQVQSAQVHRRRIRESLWSVTAAYVFALRTGRGSAAVNAAIPLWLVCDVAGVSRDHMRADLQMRGVHASEQRGML